MNGFDDIVIIGARGLLGVAGSIYYVGSGLRALSFTYLYYLVQSNRKQKSTLLWNYSSR